MYVHKTWKILSIYQFDMAVYTKIFVKFPKKFWPEGKGREFFLYASSRRGYYGVWQVVHTNNHL
jgi:polyamine oxidase